MPRPTDHLRRAVCVLLQTLPMLTGTHRIAAQAVAPPPMRARLADPRIAFLTVAAPDGAGQYITRYHLEKRHPTERVSDVVRPIVYYIDPAVPAQWRLWIERGINAWLPVLESIGFRHALVIQTALSTHTMVDQPTDTAVHLWWTKRFANPITVTPATDPETGEILGTAIFIPASIADWACRVYQIYVAGVDPQVPLACQDSLQGEQLQAIVTHEVGHSLGLGHNFRGSSVYPTDSLRSRTFLHQWGPSASIMAYGPVDYVAQPEDRVPFADKLLRIGPYDRFALAWAYRPIPGATTPEEERPTLERWRTLQDTAPYLRSPFAEEEPGDHLAARGNDLPKSAEYGIRNLARTVSRMPVSRGSRLTPSVIIDSSQQMVDHAMDVIGGVVHHGPYARDPQQNPVIPVDSAQQMHALQFAVAHVFYGDDDVVRLVVPGAVSPTPSPMVLFDRVAPGWPAAEWRAVQEHVLDALLQSDRLERLVQQHHQTHVLAALCTKMRTLHDDLATREKTAQDTTAREHVLTLQRDLDDILSTHGECHDHSTH